MKADNVKNEICADTLCMTEAYEVFPGISLLYHTAHTHSSALPGSGEAGVFEIFHCREGRMECSVDGEYCYVSPGDLFIVRNESLQGGLYFPLSHYHGITVRIDVDKAPRCLSCFLHDVSVQPRKIRERFCEDRPYFIARSNASFEHIFSELYAVPEAIREGYFKIKVLELMLFLSVFETEESESGRTVSPSQAALAKAVAEYLNENMNDRITLERLTQQFHVSATAVKSAFKAVYGVSYYAFIKTRKMESAAYMLEYTDKTVLEIANGHGYDNSSKFAVAFRSVKGMSPNEYRTKHARLQG